MSSIIFVFLITWDPYTLCFLGLYHLLSPQAFENKSVAREPCIWDFWNTFYSNLNLLSMQPGPVAFSCCVWAILQKMGNIPCLTGSSCSWLRGLHLLHPQAPDLVPKYPYCRASVDCAELPISLQHGCVTQGMPASFIGNFWISLRILEEKWIAFR